MVAQVEAQQGGPIARRQAPLVLVLGILSFVAGIGLLGFSLWALFSPAATQTRADFGLSEPDTGILTNIGPIIRWAFHSEKVDEPLLLSVGLIAGGTVGLLTGKLFKR
jgi:hypothetical protein